MSTVDWPRLPLDVLDCTTRHLDLHDFRALRRVCQGWRHVEWHFEVQKTDDGAPSTRLPLRLACLTVPPRRCRDAQHVRLDLRSSSEDPPFATFDLFFAYASTNRLIFHSVWVVVYDVHVETATRTTRPVLHQAYLDPHSAYAPLRIEVFPIGSLVHLFRRLSLKSMTHVVRVLRRYF